MRLIGLVGFQGSGKDTAGTYLVEQHGYTAFSFADSLKDTLATIFIWDRELLEGLTKESREWRETVDPWWSNKLDIPEFTPRKAMQLVGTNLFRKHFNPDIWIMNIERKLLNMPANADVVITDGRFPNELELVHQFQGKVARVKRGNEPEWFATAEAAARGYEPAIVMMADKYEIHESEWAWLSYQNKFDHVIENDDTLETLHARVENLLIQNVHYNQTNFY
jgi:hypothetical protein